MPGLEVPDIDPVATFMLIIRKRQMAEFRRKTQDEYFSRVARHLRRHFPEATEAMDNDQLHQFVEHHWPAATKFGLSSELAGCAYLEAVCGFGEKFQEQEPWAAMLADEDASENQKLLTLNEKLAARYDLKRP